LDEVAAHGLPSDRITGQQMEGSRRVLQDFWGRSTVLANIESLIASA
jgi:hypothetical protein